MADIAAGDVTYTLSGRSFGANVEDNSTRQKKVKIQFGNSTLTYPAGGISLANLSKWGFPNEVSEVILTDPGNANGYTYKWDLTNNKIRIYRMAPAGTVAAPTFTGDALATHVHDMKAIGGLTSSEALFLDASQKFGKNAATDRTVVGSTSATTGGVVAVSAGTASGTNSAPAFTGTAAALTEVSSGSFAPAATTLYALVRGH